MKHISGTGYMKRNKTDSILKLLTVMWEKLTYKQINYSVIDGL